LHGELYNEGQTRTAKINDLIPHEMPMGTAKYRSVNIKRDLLTEFEIELHEMRQIVEQLIVSSPRLITETILRNRNGLLTKRKAL
jgi:hypothetical protein